MSTEELLESSATTMGDDRIREFLTEQGVGTLALPDEVAPYLVPLSFGYDGESALYFTFLLFGAESRKETLSDRASGARFLVYDARSPHEWRSVSLRGRIEPVEEGDWADLREAMENAWHPDLFSSAEPMRGVRGYRFRIDEWTGIRQGGPSE
ncbi:pyridoxamine 5'-phosphate oxidase family protein [Halorubrum sp. 48-1-W]|uniref:pyridoxamine 5'-phosphate oxidase family protein n=1 Tax=Halorubrum sp. 48-1-W TaxID=2249761 RepID=UPI000DCCB4F8|nr:pyridoxamine 5'-phosphate oxidase family protein [Halorubrum sp. 48-1-W]RAW44509.1 pyridoxamine 5'-phosphate oxidase family protein [Halorubrum sp. 48-1-W]